MKTVRIKIGRNVCIGGNRNLCLIAGPCVIEDERMTLRLAEKLQKICASRRIPLIFKASYDKANRSSVSSFRGPGLKKGLAILEKVKREFGMPVLSDVHCVSQVGPAAEVLDVLQIPAFLCRQTDLLTAAGRTGKPVNVKKGQFVSPQEVANIIHKIEAAGNRQIIITERGTSFGYNNLVTDFCGLPVMRAFGYPVVYDATHSVQKPGGQGYYSGGRREFVPYLARAACAVGIDGLFLEVHPEPEKALSDSATVWPLKEVGGLLEILKSIDRISKHG